MFQTLVSSFQEVFYPVEGFPTYMKMRIEEPTKVGKSVTSPILDFKRYGLKNVLKERSHSLSRRAAAMNFIGR